MQNGYIESFNGKFWDECLSDTLPEARHAISVWRHDYNEVRPIAVAAECRSPS